MLIIFIKIIINLNRIISKILLSIKISIENNEEIHSRMSISNIKTKTIKIIMKNKTYQIKVSINLSYHSHINNYYKTKH